MLSTMVTTGLSITKTSAANVNIQRYLFITWSSSCIYF